jgi:hypothetical protein
MDQVELKSEKDEDELGKGAGPALTKTNDKIEISAVSQPAVEAAANLGMAREKMATKKTAVKQAKGRSSLSPVKKATAPVKKGLTKKAPAKKSMPAKKTPATAKKAATPVKQTTPARRKMTTVKNATKATKKVVAPAKKTVAPAKKAVKKVAAKKAVKKVAVKKAVKKATKK